MKCLCKFSIITHASAMAYSSAITYIAVNQQMNIIEHPYWGKIFPIQDDYAYNLICYLYINNLPFKKKY